MLCSSFVVFGNIVSVIVIGTVCEQLSLDQSIMHKNRNPMLMLNGTL